MKFNILSLLSVSKNNMRIYSILLVLLLISEASCAQRVIKVVDGDTIDVLDSTNQTTRIRFHGVDAPERAQSFGSKAKEYLASLVAGKTVVLEFVSFDKNQRTVCVVYLPSDDISINEKLIQAGYVWVDERFTKNPKWIGLQAQARNQKLGLWTEPNPTPPWVWRKQNKK